MASNHYEDEVFKNKRIPKNPIKFGITLNEEQKRAKEDILNNDIVALKGKAGSGKTATALQVALDQLFKKEIEKIWSFIQANKIPERGVFFNNQIFDAYIFSSELISKAKKSIILIDNYIDETTLLQLSKRNKKVQCIIYTEKIHDQLKLDLEKHNAQYPAIEIRILKNVHDRFLILDEKELYHIGASLKDLGKRWFAFSKLDGLVREVLNHLR